MSTVLKSTLLGACALFVLSGSALAEGHMTSSAQLGPRPFYLVDNMDDGPLKEKLMACKTGPFKQTDWSIGHRGASLQFPEHTQQSYSAAAVMGAGIIECDVTFTKDKQLVCRHAQNDLATTTNILATDLATKCNKPFTAANGDTKASAECRTSELTLAEFKSLDGKMDAGDSKATSVEEFMDSTAKWRTDLYSTKGTVLTHAESIELIKGLGAKFTPELKSASVEMPFDGYTQEMYAQAMIDEYKAAGIAPSDVFAQSFSLEDVLYWIKAEPEFGKQAVYLDDSDSTVEGWAQQDPSTWDHSMQELKDMGVNYIAPPLWYLVTAQDGKIVPSVYAKEAKAAGLKIISWSAERSGPLVDHGGWYYQSISDLINNDGDIYNLMNVLHEDVGIVGLFSDWPATTTYYANCMGL